MIEIRVRKDGDFGYRSRTFSMVVVETNDRPRELD